MSNRKLHAVLESPHEYELVEFRYVVDKEDFRQSFVEMRLQKDSHFVSLKFWQPTHLKIEEGFPEATGGMVFYDLSGQYLEDIRIEVTDFESNWGAITFFARDVERIEQASENVA
jgi:hypothetical protein